ncbi:PilY2 family type 4a fimbrial biogenesis protein [Ectothiorhodospira lacustris]|uniref:PilY2 family type 4a fimbrial biogenesis protein n=1 Tax=Ectothiorhodospira lacustris TaxID=2899127 RepID=UPI001EE8C887|nr:PilY2 family type 4a fimbrial biogenesis protein [Ectothiorhodospira lacustris]MCG5501788.1 PilY2 family type 4a fimbrial biogenesis protein [Ectothiorhodospira lacustris]MCG5509821.1 PilY2 family type 4a fimbrial biogenesis protein [Ectothiorhodospira lacustris]MCG5521074.1 PilY2 family type 4a fimbrial biogenesis protein [Ectothiorhodospira lacustris]
MDWHNTTNARLVGGPWIGKGLRVMLLAALGALPVTTLADPVSIVGNINAVDIARGSIIIDETVYRLSSNLKITALDDGRSHFEQLRPGTYISYLTTGSGDAISVTHIQILDYLPE